MVDLRRIVWVCDRCDTTLQGNPRLCWKCGYTVYRPTFPEPHDERPAGAPVSAWEDS